MKLHTFFLLFVALVLQCSHNNLIAAEEKQMVPSQKQCTEILFYDYNTDELYTYYPDNNSTSAGILTLFQRPGIDINTKNFYGDTVLHYACQKNCTEQVEALLCLDKINPNEINKKGLTPLL